MGKQYDVWRREGSRAAGIITLTAAVLLVCSIFGTKRNTDYRMSSLEASMEESQSQSVEESLRESEEESVQASVEESLREETAVHEAGLTYMEEQLLGLIAGYMENEDLENAARVIHANEKALEQLFFAKLADGFFLYDGSRMTDQADGHGLVLTRTATMFYGDFKDGKPEGECLGLQVVDLEEGVRYDFSKGIWRDGQMNGDGSNGYNYYEGVSGNNVMKITRSGEFSKDLMDGPILYSSTNGDGETTLWTVEVEDGILVLDGRWAQETGEDGSTVWWLLSDDSWEQVTGDDGNAEWRQLPSADGGHVYSVTDSDTKEVRWRNMIQY